MLKNISAIYGLLFAATGIAGFFPNPIIGPEGFFLTDAPHNIIHLVLGAILLFGITSDKSGANAIRAVAAIYLILAIAGFIQFGIRGESGLLLGITRANSSDNWLHIALSLILIASYKIGAGPERMNMS